ncbi:TonB-dependent receptor [Sphingomonas sp. QA11]|uniref:TonB-dependent receptor n=1 Tax=Sphingomonas sp. QA11 TaxID=2950605 RepID=UPI00234A30FD|nr:TonB-dependent receptor [Sphingomonas sp. QA11]WCM27071.1 TonB-dependent receptor [Sphingomonas sp. QA11]
MTNMDSGRHFRFVALAGAAPLALLAQPATAQTALDGQHLASNDATATDEAADDVVVTARRRSERAQDVPIALSVVSEESLRARGDYTLGTIQQSVPSLQVFSFNPRNTNVNIRGLGSNVALTNDGLENGVGIYIDQVYYGRLGQSQFELVDLDRIEVLRGPQGTLFGKNTTAGAINITSKAPTFDLQGFGEATGGNYGFHQVRGSISGGLIDNLVAARISISDTHRDGFISNITTGRKVHDFDNFTARGQLLITPTPNLTARIIADYGKQKQNCCIPLIAGVITKYDNGAPIANNFIDRVNRAGYTPLPFTPFARVTDAEANFQANMDTWGVSGQLDWDVGPVTLTSVTASRQWNWFPANDADYTALPVNLKSQQQNNQRQFSQELRLASNGTNRIDYVVGAYYFYQIIRGYGSSAYGSAAPKWLFPAQYAADPVATNAAVNGFEAQSQSTPVTRSYALFGQTVWHISDALSLTTGLRYTHEKKVGGFAQQQVAGLSLAGLTQAQRTAAQALRNQLNPVTAYTAETSDDSLSGLATLSWKATDDVLLYASYSRGNKSGGLNLSNLPAGVSAVVAPEKVDNYEVGVKSQLFNRALTLNAAAFWTDVANYQTAITEQIPSTTNFRNYITNIPLARSRGVEADAVWAITSKISLNLSGAYTDAYYVSYPKGPTPVETSNISPSTDLSGKPLAGVPKWTFTGGGDFRRPLGGGTELYGHADYSWRSSFYTAVSDSRFSLVPSYGIGNARIGVRLDGGRYDLSVWAKNIFDKDYFQTLSIVASGVITANLGDPRTAGATFRVRI